MSGLTTGHLRFETVNTRPNPDNNAELVPDGDVKLQVRKALGLAKAPTPDPAYTRAKTVAPSTVTVTVLNGSGSGGVAATSARVLSTAGFHTSAGDAPAQVDTTTITYAAGMEAQAKTLAQYVPGATVTRSTTVDGVTLTLGTDGKQAHSAPATPAPTAPSTGASTPTPSDGGCIN